MIPLLSSLKCQLTVYGPVPPDASAAKLNVAGALPDVAFEVISAARDSVAGGSSSVAGSSDDSSTVISKVSVAVSPLESVAFRVTVYLPASLNVCETVCSSLSSLSSPKFQLTVYGPVPPAIVALKLNVAGATSTSSSVSFEVISAARDSVAGGSSSVAGSSSVGDSSTVISKVSDAVSPSLSVVVRVTV